LAKHLYILSGLGAEKGGERIFQRIDVSGFSKVFIQWVAPHDNETIEQYATRLLVQIKTSNPTLIGLSFGGMMAIEIAKQIETEKVILIASAKTKNELPFYYRWAGKLGIHKLLSIKVLRKSRFVTYWFFGVETRNEKKLLNQILLKTDASFLRWAIDKITKWTNQIELKNTFHIHGSTDRILPLKFVNCNSIIHNGGHFMTINKAEELNKIIEQQLVNM
jgi:pimeloyl-ACP methyl ester carboxylesterase